MALASSGSSSSRMTKDSWSSWRTSEALSSSDTLPSSASSTSPSSRASGLTSTRVASSSTKTSHSACTMLDRLLAQRLGERGLLDDLAGLGLVDAGARVDRDLLDGVRVGLGDLLDLDAALDRGDAEVLPVGPVEQEGEVVLLRGGVAGATRTRLTGRSLMVSARMFVACSKASSGVLAILTPPALPRPPALTCALITVTPPSCSAAARASSADCTTTPSVVLTPCFAKSSFAWYSIRSTGPPRCLVGRKSGLARLAP